MTATGVVVDKDTRTGADDDYWSRARVPVGRPASNRVGAIQLDDLILASRALQRDEYPDAPLVVHGALPCFILGSAMAGTPVMDGGVRLSPEEVLAAAPEKAWLAAVCEIAVEVVETAVTNDAAEPVEIHLLRALQQDIGERLVAGEDLTTLTTDALRLIALSSPDIEDVMARSEGRAPRF